MKLNLSSQFQSWEKVHFKNSKVTILRHLMGVEEKKWFQKIPIMSKCNVFCFLVVANLR